MSIFSKVSVRDCLVTLAVALLAVGSWTPAQCAPGVTSRSISTPTQAAASALAFWQPDLFHGTIQDCGTDFYRAVSRAANQLDSSGRPYGILPAMSPDMEHEDCDGATLSKALNFLSGR
jgi:hypothetical protein